MSNVHMAQAAVASNGWSGCRWHMHKRRRSGQIQKKGSATVATSHHDHHSSTGTSKQSLNATARTFNVFDAGND